MKKLLILFCLIASQVDAFAQAESFEGVLIYELNTNNGIEKSSNISRIKYSVKGNLWRGEIVGNEDSIAPVSYSLLVNLKSKEATILANISNTKMAVATSESFFQIEKTNSFSLESGSKKLTIAGLECKSGVIQSKSDDQKIDTTYVWYSTSYAAIPFQFETASAPGLIVSIQQDKNSFWELSEIIPGNLSPEIFEVPADYKPMSMTEFQEYLAALGELEIEVENIELD
jgi:hypothetical protein